MMRRKLGTWLLGLAACAQTSCYQHHTADEELLGLPGSGPGDAVSDGGRAGAIADAGTGAAGDGGAGCPGTDPISQLTCAFLSDAGAGNINDVINSLGGLGAIAGLFGGTGGGAAPGRDAGSPGGALPGGAQCQNATDLVTQFFCGLQGGGAGGALPFGRRDGGVPSMMQNPPPAQPADAGTPAVEDAGAPPADAEVDAAAVP